jgi:hypothetical protein
MPRAQKTHDGAISDVSEPAKHAAGWRVRFKHNGVWAASCRTSKEEITTLHKQLTERAAVAAVKLNMVPTSLNQDQVKNAEMAFRTLINGRLVDEADPTSYQAIVKAAEKLVQAMDRREQPVSIRQAYELFKEQQVIRKLEASTRRDYDRFVEPFIAQVKGTTQVRAISAKTCQEYITSYKDAERFKCHGYFAAFFKFCAGKNNPHINPGDAAWVRASPVNFEKAGYTPKDVFSYTLPEIKTLLRAAKKSGALGYIVFRLHSMCRYAELLRFLKAGNRFDHHPKIDLANNNIHFGPDVYRKRSKGEHRGRHIPIGKCFRAWIVYCIKKRLRFSYDRESDQMARKAVRAKYGAKYKNLLRHSGITMRVKANEQTAMEIAKAAGTSTAVIESSYLDLNITKAEALAFLRLTPRAMGWS